MVYIRGLFTSTLEKRKTECKYLVHNIMYNMKQIQQLLVHFTRSNNTQEGTHIRLHGENTIDLMHKKLFLVFREIETVSFTSWCICFYTISVF